MGLDALRKLTGLYILLGTIGWKIPKHWSSDNITYKQIAAKSLIPLDLLILNENQMILDNRTKWINSKEF